MTDTVTIDLHGDVAVISLDDGKANALSHTVLEALDAAFDRAEAEARGVVIAGRPGMFSAGFDLKVMQSSSEAMRDLVGAGTTMLLRIFDFPLPVVTACTGHALAAGALMLLASDFRVGVSGEFKIGLPEVSIGMPLPIFGVELARARLAAPLLERATVHAEVFDPEQAFEAGFLDAVVDRDAVLERAIAEAARLGALDRSAFTVTRRHIRGASERHIRDTLADDIAGLTLGGR